MPGQALLERNLHGIGQAWAFFPYEPIIRKFIASLKFERNLFLMKELEELILPAADAIASTEYYDAVVAVPMDRFRYASRGLSLSARIARIVAGRICCPVRDGWLTKRFGVDPQSRLRHQERLANLYGAFKIIPKSRVMDRQILLVDDIVTTGSTAQEAARVLKEAGVKRVDLFAFAETTRTANQSREVVL